MGGSGGCREVFHSYHSSRCVNGCTSVLASWPEVGGSLGCAVVELVDGVKRVGVVVEERFEGGVDDSSKQIGKNCKKDSVDEEAAKGPSHARKEVAPENFKGASVVDGFGSGKLIVSVSVLGGGLVVSNLGHMLMVARNKQKIK